MTKKVSTPMGITTILIAIAIFFGGVFAYAYFAVQKIDGQLQAQLQAKTAKTHR